eukprot:TRINITY_DN10201_c0_g1_i2.p1 TRINITY_DN10201_c0_g1~~TRINITY_DN10201_c0_g1_i2.p1  ORF type:complete len:836 (+),score=158.64 TRINITY_DN10201_c0_g1_i2:50-2509(+)
MPSVGLQISTFLSVLLPCALLVGCFSSIGIAHTIFNYVAEKKLNMLGNAAACAAVCLLAFLYVVDFHLRTRVFQAVCGVIQIAICIAAAVLKGVAYPWTPGLLCLVSTVLLIGFLRVSAFRRDSGTSGKAFFSACAISYAATSLCSGVGWAVWIFVADKKWNSSTKLWLVSKHQPLYDTVWKSGKLIFDTHCAPGVDLSKLTPALNALQQAAIKKACLRASSVWTFAWGAPFVCAVVCLIAAGFCFVFARTATRVESSDANAAVASLQRVLKGCVLTVVLMIGFMWSSVQVAGAAVKLSAAMFALGCATISATVGWVCLEVDFSVLRRMTTQGKMASNIFKIMRNDWVRAMMIFGLNAFIPIMASLDIIRQKQRQTLASWREEQTDDDHYDKFTPNGRRLVNELSLWNWGSILTKVDLFGELFLAVTIGTKVTYMSFSWLNDVLAATGIDFYIISVMVFFIGIVMFLIPIVPGTAVYLFSGVVLGKLSSDPGGPGFAIGVVLACAWSSLAKHIACVGQYMMGYAAGKSLKVQQMVGVDQVPTRAAEQILKTKGFSVGKVCILVAGPDFPTSMLCGILRINIPWMLVGTTPVILVSIIPQCLVGAILTQDGEGILGMISTAVTGVAAAVQAAATMLYAYRIMKVVDTDGAKLAEWREEHAAVAELTKKEEAFVACYREASKWDNMSNGQKFVLLGSAVGLIFSGLALTGDTMIMDTPYFLRKFSITDKIEKPWDEGGLDNRPWTLVIDPYGYMILGLSVISVCMHITFNCWMNRTAQAMLAKGEIPQDYLEQKDKANRASESLMTSNMYGSHSASEHVNL